MELSLFFAGTAGSVPTARRGLPALLVRAGGDRLLFDCGEGTQQQLLRSVGLPELDAVFLTHFHLDHWLGLIGMIKTFDLRARERPLTVYGPPGLRALMEGLLRPVIGRTGYPLRIVELEPHEEVAFDGYLIGAFPVEHRVTAYGYGFVEADRPGRFDAATPARSESRRAGLRAPPAWGGGRRRAAGAGGRAGPPRPARRDLRRHAPVPDHGGLRARGRRARPRGDVPRRRARPGARDGALDRRPGGRARAGRRRAAARAHPPVHALLPARGPREAQAVFPSTVVPRDFDVIEVPFPERGEPVLVKGGREPEPDAAIVPRG